MKQATKATVNSKNKDSLFRIIFKDKRELLQLYNALAGTAYDNPEELTINTKEDIIYMYMKNDISFLLDARLNLYEHQSTYNPNMPLRGFLYLAALYKPMVMRHRLYSQSLLRIPNPKYVVFYNGPEEMEDRRELRLSEAFSRPEEGGDVEVVAHMININYGHNQELLEKCRKLKEYALFVATVRRHLQEGTEKEEAVERAIDECIGKDILSDILRKERAVVCDSVLTEFDEEEFAALMRKEGKIEGKAEAVVELLEELGEVPQDLKKVILEERNPERLRSWHKLSAKAESIEKFRKMAGI